MKRTVFLLMAAVLCAALLASCGTAGTPRVGTGKPLEFVRSFPDNPSSASGAVAQGKLYKAGKIDVVVLEGTYREMGRQYGALLEEVLKDNYEGIAAGVEGIEGLGLEDLQELGDSIYSTYPRKYREIIDGLAETSGLGLDKAKLLNAQEEYVFSRLIKLVSEGDSGCTGMAAWGPYTSGEPLVFGRNYDLGPAGAPYVTLTVYNPIDGSLPTANVTFAGCIYVTSGMNRAGLFLELNNGSYSDPSDFFGTRPFAPVELFGFLEQSENLRQLDVFFNSTLPDLSYIINAADKKSACSYEWSASTGAKRRAPDLDGLLIATNCFFTPGWGTPLPDPADDTDFMVLRRDNLLALAEKQKGKFDAGVMMKVISTPLEEGGAFRAPNLTSFEIVAEPGALKMWVRVPEYQEWVEIDLAQYFAK